MYCHAFILLLIRFLFARSLQWSDPTRAKHKTNWFETGCSNSHLPKILWCDRNAYNSNRLGHASWTTQSAWKKNKIPFRVERKIVRTTISLIPSHESFSLIHSIHTVIHRRNPVCESVNDVNYAGIIYTYSKAPHDTSVYAVRNDTIKNSMGNQFDCIGADRHLAI